MEISFRDVEAVEARALAEELRLALNQAGLPIEAVTIEQASGEAVNLGSVLGVDIELPLHALGAVGYIACFEKCMFELTRGREASDRATRVSTLLRRGV